MRHGFAALLLLALTPACACPPVGGRGDGAAHGAPGAFFVGFGRILLDSGGRGATSPRACTEADLTPSRVKPDGAREDGPLVCVGG